MFEASIDGFGGAACGMGMIKVGQDVPGSAFERSSQRDDLREGARHSHVAETVYFGLHQGLTADFIGIAIGINNALVDAPGDFEGDVAIAGEQVEDPVLLAWDEQAGSGVEHTASLVEGIRAPAAPMVEFMLNAPTTLIESITGEVYDVEGVHDRGCVWELFSGCAFEPGESIHRYDLDVLAPCVRLGGQDLLGAARDHIQEPGGAATISYGSHVQDDGNDSCRHRGCDATRVHQRR